MDTADFLTLWANMELRQFVIDIAKTFIRSPRKQEALVYYAWLNIGNLDADKSTEYYKGVSYRIMDRYYTHHIMARGGRFKSWDNGIRRAKAKIKKKVLR
jgi:hypothetical protein